MTSNEKRQRLGKINLSKANEYRAEQGNSALMLLFKLSLAGIVVVWLMRDTSAGQEIAQAIPELHFVKQQAQVSPYARYPHGDPSCGGDTFCLGGWRLW